MASRWGGETGGGAHGRGRENNVKGVGRGPQVRPRRTAEATDDHEPGTTVSEGPGARASVTEMRGRSSLQPDLQVS